MSPSIFIVEKRKKNANSGFSPMNMKSNSCIEISDFYEKPFSRILSILSKNGTPSKEVRMGETRIHRVERIRFSGNRMNLIVDDQEYRVNVDEISDRLARADQEQRGNFEVSPSGYGIHWPEIDEDVSIDGIIGTKTAVREKTPRKSETAAS